MKALKPVLMSILMVTMVSTASPVYAAENIVFHMSFYVHNWRGEIGEIDEITSLEFYDGAGASDEEAPEPIIIVDDEEPDAELIVDEEDQVVESSDSEQIPSVVIEEITSEPRTEPTSDPVDEPYAEQITVISTEVETEEI